MHRGFPILLSILLTIPVATAADGSESAESYRWLPVQKPPKGLARTHFDLMAGGVGPSGRAAPGSLGPEHMMVQSLAGLAAQAVNEGRSDEMIWVGLDNSSYDLWYRGVMERLAPEDRGSFAPWDLARRYVDMGLVRGYILYRYDYSEGDPTEYREDMDLSVNVATSLAGIYQGILVSECIEERAKALGLACLADVRDKSQAWCFEEYRDRLSRRHVLAQSPKMPHNRSIAIAHRMFTFFGTAEPAPALYRWLEPLSTVLGWNGGDEGRFVSQLCRESHMLYPSNWAVNLAVMSAGTEDFDADPRFKTIDPARLDWSDTRPAVAYVMSDGDNVQWMLGNFCMHPYYWGNPHHGDFPLGWGLAYACLDQSGPYARDYLARTQPETSSAVLCSGGYYYPDLLGIDRGPAVREAVLRAHARRLNHFMKRSGGNLLMSLFWDLDSAEAQRAYRVFAEEIDALIGVLGFQYYPYEGGRGKVYWVARPDGVEIPVVTARYAIWAGLKHERAGSPAKIARLIHEDARDASEAAPLHAWAVVHAWSTFNPAPPDADDMAEEPDSERGGQEAGVTPTQWSVDRVGDLVRVVTPEEMIWRLRMHHDPETTRREIARVAAERDAPSP